MHEGSEGDTREMNGKCRECIHDGYGGCDNVMNYRLSQREQRKEEEDMETCLIRRISS